ncbi:MAG: hypothetical protein AB9856_15385 [Cellulosilyticaceae bacterium]
MNDYLQTLNLIDLVSQKHKKLRKEVIRLWLEKNEEEISDTESHMLGMLEIENITIAESARKMNVSRQAAHKCAKKLIEKDYIMIKAIDGNKRDKLMGLTKKGEAYCYEMLKIKKQIEEEIASNIGHQNVALLKDCLRKDWINN